MKSFRLIIGILFFVSLLISAGSVKADTIGLEQRLDNLESQVAELKQELKQQKQADVSQVVHSMTDQTKPAAFVTANSKDGFSIQSSGGDYKLQIGGYAQFEAREFASNNKEDLQTDHGSSTSYDEDSEFLARRVRLMIQGTVARDFDFYIQPEFGYNNASSTVTSAGPSAYSPALQDAWLDWKYFPEATIKAGKFKTPFDLENLQDTRYTAFTEIGLTGNLSPQRDLGAQIGGSVWDNRITYAGGIFDGAADHENPYGGSSTVGYDSNNKSGTGRIFITPFKDTSFKLLSGLGIGYAATYGKEESADLPTYVTSNGQAPFFSYTTAGVSADGPQYREEPQAYYYYRSLGILAEAVESQEELQYTSGGHVIRTSPDNKAYELTGTYVLTGENASYNGVIPDHNFDPGAGHWGALELALRYGELKIDHSVFDDGFASLNTSASQARAWATGINWYLNHNVKLAFAYEQTKFRRGAAAGVNGGNRKTDNLFTGLLQLSF